MGSKPAVWAGIQASRQVIQICHTSERNGTSKALRGLVSGYPCNVTAVAAAHEADSFRIGVALFYHPVEAVDDIVLHFQSPLFITSDQKFVSETSRAPVVGFEHSVTTAVKKLNPVVKSVCVSNPGTTVGQDNRLLIV